jgi:hypothetical protein
MPGLEDLYREIILDHYRTPRNRGELAPPASKVPLAPLSPKLTAQSSFTLNLISPTVNGTISATHTPLLNGVKVKSGDAPQLLYPEPTTP